MLYEYLLSVSTLNSSPQNVTVSLASLHAAWVSGSHYEWGHRAAGDGKNSPFRQKQEAVPGNGAKKTGPQNSVLENRRKKKNPNYTFPPKEYDYVKKHMLSLLWHLYL